MANPKFSQAKFEELTDKIVEAAAIRTFNEGYGPADEGSDSTSQTDSPEATMAEIAELRGKFNWVKSKFLEHLPPDPKHFDAPIGYLEKVPEAFGKANQQTQHKTEIYKDGPKFAQESMNTIARLETVGADWDGNAALAFRDSVRIPLPYVIVNSIKTSEALVSAYERA